MTFTLPFHNRHFPLSDHSASLLGRRSLYFPSYPRLLTSGGLQRLRFSISIARNRKVEDASDELHTGVRDDGQHDSMLEVGKPEVGGLASKDGVYEGFEWKWPPWKGLPTGYKLIGTTSLAFVVCNMDKVNLSIAIIPMSHQYGWNSSTAGIVQASFFWGYALSQLPGGWLAKLLGGRKVLEIGVFSWSLATILVPFAAGFMPGLILSRILEINFAEDQIHSSDALVEMSQGQWEGCLSSEIYTPEMACLIDKSQPDFSPPLGESLRQVEFRMIEFISKTALRIPEKLFSGEPPPHHNDAKDFSRHSSINSAQDRDGPQWDLHYRLNRTGIPKKKSGKSRLQFMTTGDDHDNDEEPHQSSLMRESNPAGNPPTTSIGIFTHATPIKCLVTCLLGCNPAMSMKICIDDSSVTVLQHSLRKGWRIKRLNDTSHLRLL